jgi:hypothetical protein
LVNFSASPCVSLDRRYSPHPDGALDKIPGDRIIERRDGEVVQLTGAETQAFLRLLRWAEANGRIERMA